ncbi:MAG: thymidylate kinase, partial [Candidatus Diapherotrites archaeon]|nr:thymidylate kinase [Candidatus Diapherotrites archaeon]
MQRGTFITIEGIHGSGKSTISRLLVAELKRKGLDVVLSVDQAGTSL